MRMNKGMPLIGALVAMIAVSLAGCGSPEDSDMPPTGTGGNTTIATGGNTGTGGNTQVAAPLPVMGKWKFDCSANIDDNSGTFEIVSQNGADFTGRLCLFTTCTEGFIGKSTVDEFSASGPRGDQNIKVTLTGWPIKDGSAMALGGECRFSNAVIDVKGSFRADPM